MTNGNLRLINFNCWQKQSGKTGPGKKRAFIFRSTMSTKDAIQPTDENSDAATTLDWWNNNSNNSIINNNNNK